MKMYKNGNTIVAIGKDGTKIRYIRGEETPQPEFPESIDLKITNKCSMNCPMCHEQSKPSGLHADLHSRLLKSLHPYTELAIGGGDPMSHPEIEGFLKQMNWQNVICNMTVHWQSFLENFKTLKKWTERKLIYGLGVSVNEIIPCEVFDKLGYFSNAVIHAIIGIADEAVFRQTMDRNLNLLLLGYKTFGRGEKYCIDKSFTIAENTQWIQARLEKLPEHYKAVSFDRLAIEQLELKQRLKPEVFDQIYMGDDGDFTMYIDLVKNEYAVSSVSERRPIESDNVEELFKDVRKCRHGKK